MLNVTVQKSPEAAKKYFAKSDYYAEGQQEIAGEWGGKGAVLLGLFGQVDKRRFDLLCDNINPQTGKQLTAINRDGRRTGFDFTWSAPKSASLVHAVTGDERIVSAFRQSVGDTMKEMEADMQTRVRKDGADASRTTANMVWAEFVHLTSRPVNGVPDPQLHIHIFCQNATYDWHEEQWKAGQFGAIKDSGYYWQAVQQARFADVLQKLGYSIRRTQHAFEIDGVPQSAIDKFSKRTQQIETKAEKVAKQLQVDVLPPKLKAALGAATREAKNTSTPYPQLAEIWSGQLDLGERLALRRACHEPHSAEHLDREHVERAVQHAFERASVVAERRLLTAALRRGVGSATPEGVRSELAKAGLINREKDGVVWTTTRELLAEERRMIRYATSGRGTCKPITGDRDALAAELAGTELSGEQAAAVAHVMTSTDSVMIIEGIAGTGKTTLTRQAVRLIEEAGKPVVMVAPSAQASRGVLRGEGFALADTLTHFMDDEAMQQTARGGVIWLDEAGMVGTKTMASFFDVAKKLDARVVLAGDTHQLSGVEHGDALRVLEEIGGIKPAIVAVIRRQSGQYRSAVKLLAQGKTAEGLTTLDAMGCIKLLPSWDSYAPVAKEYVARVTEAEALGRDKDKAALIVCPTHAESAKITAEVRKQLKEAGIVGQHDHEFTQLVPTQWTQAQRSDAEQYGGGEMLQFHRNTGRFKAGQRVEVYDGLIKDELAKRAANFATYTKDVIRLAEGDVIRITGNGFTKARDHRLNNGSFYRIEGFTDSGDIKLTNGWLLDKNYGQLALGYVSTAQAAQGRTVEHVIVVQSAMSSPASNMAGFYVGVSRGRRSVSIFTDSRDELRSAVVKSHRRMSATELVEKPTLLQRARTYIGKVRAAAQIAEKAVERANAYEREAAYAR